MPVWCGSWSHSVGEEQKERFSLLIYYQNFLFCFAQLCVWVTTKCNTEKTSSSLILRPQSRARALGPLTADLSDPGQSTYPSSGVFPQATIFIMMFTQFSASIFFTYPLCTLFVLCGEEQVKCFQPFHSSCSDWALHGAIDSLEEQTFPKEMSNFLCSLGLTFGKLKETRQKGKQGWILSLST